MLAAKTYRIIPLSELAPNVTDKEVGEEQQQQEEEESATHLILAKLSIVASSDQTIATTTTADVSYPRGTLYLTDSTGVKVPCRLTKCRMAWYDRFVLIRSWRFIIMKANNNNTSTSTWVEADSDEVADVPNGHPILVYTPGTSVSFNLESLWKTFQDPKNRLLPGYLLTNPNIMTLQSLSLSFSPSLSPKSNPLNNLTILARVRAKSSLRLKPGSAAFFFIEICDINSTSIYSFMMFRGDEFLRFYEYLQVEQCYIFVQCKVQTLIVGPMNKKKKVLVFGEDIFPISEPEAERIFDQIPMPQPMPQQLQPLPSDSSSLVSASNHGSNSFIFTNISSNSLASSSSQIFRYRGIITSIIDISMGLFVLDNTYLLSLAHNFTYFPEHPYIVGTELLLDNVHFIKICGNWSLAKESLDPYETLPICWMVFVACTYTSIQVIETSQKQNLHKVGPSFVNVPLVLPYEQRLSFWLRSNYSFLYSVRLLELVTAWKRKFPNNMDGIIQNMNEPELPFSRLMQRIYNVQPMKRDLIDEFVNHKTEPCRILFGNEKLDPNSPTSKAHIIGTPDLLKFWSEILMGTLLKSMKSWQAIDDEGQSDDMYLAEEFASYDSPTKEAHSLLYGQYLLGVLFVGHEDDGLFLRDESYKIPVIIDGGASIRVEELGHMWCIKRFRVVIEKHRKKQQRQYNSTTNDSKDALVKAYLHLDWDHTSRLLVRLKNSTSKLANIFRVSRNKFSNAFIFQVRRKESLKDSNENMDLEVRYVEGISLAIEKAITETTQNSPLVSLHPPVNVVLSFDLATRRFGVLSALQVGCWYYIIPDSEINFYGGHLQNFTVTKEWIWRSFASDRFGETLELKTDLNLVDLFGNSLPPLELRLEEKSQQRLLEAHKSFRSDNLN